MKTQRILFVVDSMAAQASVLEFEQFWRSWAQDEFTLYRALRSELNDQAENIYLHIQAERFRYQPTGWGWAPMEKIWIDEFDYLIAANYKNEWAAQAGRTFRWLSADEAREQLAGLLSK